MRLTLITTAARLLLVSAALGQSPSPGPTTMPESTAVSAPLGVSGQTIAPTTAGSEMVSLNFPPDSDLSTFVDYVSRRLALNIMIDDTVGTRKLTLDAPTAIPASSLEPLLESVLRMKGLAIINSDIPGWKRVVGVSTLNPIAQPATSQPNANVSPSAVVTQVFSLQYASPRDADTTIKQFLTQPGGLSQSLPDQHLLIVTDYASNLPRIAALLRQIDRLGRDSTIQFVPVKNADATELAPQVKQLMNAKLHAEGGSDEEQSPIEVFADARTSQLEVIGRRDRVAEVVDVVQSLDVPVRAEQNPVRFYKLANATAADVASTLREISGEPPAASPRVRSSDTQSDQGIEPFPSQTADLTATPNAAGIAQTPGTPFTPGTSSTAGTPFTPGGVSNAPAAGVAGSSRQPAVSDRASVGGSTANPADEVKGRHVTIVADTNTNTIIVVADPSTQKLYEQLIASLDKRRPQVMLEATVVTLDTTNDFSLGVDVSEIASSGNRKIITFSSFGVSTVDAATGQLSLIPGMGLNGAVLGTDVANIALRTLASNSHAKVIASPRVLVNDNMLGHLSSVSKQPFTSTNALTGNTTTTSFGGYADAGTDILLTPHISEDNYLQLEYEITLSNFTGVSSDGIPPPEQENKVQSKVTIPDGSSIVVGGLNMHNVSRTLQKVPLLGDVPVLKYLFQAQTSHNETSTLFVFIRPVILRDDQFKDLQYLSARDIARAAIHGDFPNSEPLPMR